LNSVKSFSKFNEQKSGRSTKNILQQ